MASADPERDVTGAPTPPEASQEAQNADEISPNPSSTHVDDNYALYKSGREIEVSPAEQARVLRKIDFRIIPILFVTYMLQYLDKNSINFSSVYGLQKGTHLKGQDYSWLGASPTSHLYLSRYQVSNDGGGEQVPSSTLATCSSSSLPDICSSVYQSANFSLWQRLRGALYSLQRRHVFLLEASRRTDSSSGRWRRRLILASCC
jgi:hypothetical protein